MVPELDCEGALRRKSPPPQLRGSLGPSTAETRDRGLQTLIRWALVKSPGPRGCPRFNEADQVGVACCAASVTSPW